MIMAFLDHVENGRGSCVRTRNGRLAAIRSFFRYIEYRVPACLDQALRHSIPTKKTDKALIDYLDRAEIKALLDAPDPRTRLGTRDRAMLHLAYAGGLRVSELVTLQLRDFPDRSCPPCTSWERAGVNGSCRSGRRPRSHCAHGLRSAPKRRFPRYSSMPTGSP
jgi:site-specific recombinase XerD